MDKNWTFEELRLAVALFRSLLGIRAACLSVAGERELRFERIGEFCAQTGRGRKSADLRLGNISFVLAEMGLPTHSVYGAAKNVGSNVEAMIRLAAARVFGADIGADSRAATLAERRLAARLGELGDERRAATESVIEARRGAGVFGERVLARWGGACALTGVADGHLLRVVHCLPWAAANDEQRLDADNGLPLRADLAALFDRLQLSFCDGGDLLFAPSASAEARALARSLHKLRSPLTLRQIGFLREHRALALGL
jgi:hypothetical protein